MLDQHQKAFIKALKLNAYRHHPREVFTDWCEMAACALANPFDLTQREGREARYLRIVKKYNPDEVARLSEMLALLTLSLEDHFSDALGAIYMELELGNAGGGQFFTPYDICRLMARMTAGDAAQTLKDQEFITVAEPAVGGGAMIIALADHLHAEGMVFQQRIHVTAVDIDLTAVHMAYIQFSLLGIPAVVIHGNTLSLEEWSRWYTPMHFLGFWDAKLRRRSEQDAPSTAPIMPTVLTGQLTMFGGNL